EHDALPLEAEVIVERRRAVLLDDVDEPLPRPRGRDPLSRWLLGDVEPALLSVLIERHTTRASPVQAFYSCLQLRSAVSLKARVYGHETRVHVAASLGVAHKPAGADRPDLARWNPRRCIPPGAAVLAWLWLLRRADRARLGVRPHRSRVGGADEAPRLHALRRPGGRRGRLRHRLHGAPSDAGALGIADQLPAKSEQERVAHNARDVQD